ncbi:MAG TPA: hypothetical protein VNO31_31575 [Umezawaea sp.]|nr:hypothetical protein [Umezawaea sp.]
MSDRGFVTATPFQQLISLFTRAKEVGLKDADINDWWNSAELAHQAMTILGIPENEHQGYDPERRAGMTFPGHDAGVTDEPCTPTNPCRSCRERMAAKDAPIEPARPVEDRDYQVSRSAANEYGQREFERGRTIGQSEREAELLEAGWTPPGTVHELEVSTGPTDADLWETALQIAGSQRNRRELEHTRVRADAVWFYQELKAGPDDAVDWRQVSKYNYDQIAKIDSATIPGKETPGSEADWSGLSE